MHLCQWLFTRYIWILSKSDLLFMMNHQWANKIMQSHDNIISNECFRSTNRKLFRRKSMHLYFTFRCVQIYFLLEYSKVYPLPNILYISVLYHSSPKVLILLIVTSEGALMYFAIKQREMSLIHLQGKIVMVNS